MSDTGIRVNCSRCGTEVDSSQRTKSGICGVCLVRQETAPTLNEYRRLWSKRLSYQAKHAPLANIERQLFRLAKRVNAHVHGRIAHNPTAVDLINHLLAEARAQAESRGTSIQVAQTSSLLVRT